MLKKFREQKVLVLYNRPRKGAPDSEGVLEEVEAVVGSLKRLKIPYDVEAIEEIHEVYKVVHGHPCHRVFNLVESLGNNPLEACLVPSVIRSLGKECTGSPTVTLLSTTHKAIAKRLLERNGIATPNWALIQNHYYTPRLQGLNLPIIVKPCLYDGSEGIISDENIFYEVSNSLYSFLDELKRRYPGPILVEEMVGEREVNVSVLEIGGQPIVLPLSEIDFSQLPHSYPKIVDYRAKWVKDSFLYSNTPRIIPPDLSHGLEKEIRNLALKCWELFKCRGYIRIDIRIERDGTPYVLEINANPDISPSSGFVASLKGAGLDHDFLVGNLIPLWGMGTEEVKKCAL